jgi:hypothetical protein
MLKQKGQKENLPRIRNNSKTLNVIKLRRIFTWNVQDDMNGVVFQTTTFIPHKNVCSLNNTRLFHVWNTIRSQLSTLDHTPFWKPVICNGCVKTENEDGRPYEVTKSANKLRDYQCFKLVFFQIQPYPVLKYIKVSQIRFNRGRGIPNQRKFKICRIFL